MLMSVVWSLAGVRAFGILRYLTKQIPIAIKASGVKKLYFGVEFHEDEKSSKQLKD